MSDVQPSILSSDLVLLPEPEAAALDASEGEDDALVLDLPTPAETFAVRDDASANWVIRKVLEARMYARRVTEWAEREKRRALREEQFFLGRYGPQLSEWCRAEIGKLKGRRKSLNLPAGCVGIRIHGLVPRMGYLM